MLSELYDKLIADASATAEDYEAVAKLHEESHLYQKATIIRLVAPKAVVKQKIKRKRTKNHPTLTLENPTQKTVRKPRQQAGR
jgi:hypothetical protein